MGERQHDAGSKSRMPLLPGVMGYALFVGDRQEHRLWLDRRPIGTDGYTPYVLCLGMNPSSAAADEDDLTLRKDQQFASILGFARVMKANAGSYCCTDPSGLSARGVVVSHPMNLPTIRRLAADAGAILLATGDPPDILRPYAMAMFRELRRDGRTAVCLGVTKGGWPKHTSRLAYATPFQAFAL
jgi:hypothetical protein